MLKSLKYLLLLFLLTFLFTCGEKKDNTNIDYTEQAAYDPKKDIEIQQYNLEQMKKEAKSRFPCDTIAVIENILNYYPSGTYLLKFDKTVNYNIPGYAVYYYKDSGGNNFVFCVIARSRPGERLIEPSNVVGFDQSYIDLDSTKLGTPFLYLVLYECNNEMLNKIWEAPIPSHGGFNKFSLKSWNYNRTPYIETNFHYAQGVGHINYNYFMIDGIRNYPFLLMTYEGTDFKRTMANVNNDKYPDYYEYVYVSLPDRIYPKDSVAFIYSEKDSVFINTRNSKQTRRY